MFRGANKVTLDAKGRVAMPARYRDTLVERSEGRLVATVDRADKCLLIYPLPDWEEIERKLMRLPTLNPQARRLQRLMVRHATDLELDSHARKRAGPGSGPEKGRLGLQAPPEIPPGGDRLPASPAARVENAVSIALLVGMAVLPLLEIVGRRVWRTGIPGSNTLVQHATLWIGCLGGAIAARGGRLLSIGRLSDRFPEPYRRVLAAFTAAVSTAISLLLAWSGFQLVRAEWADRHYVIPILPLWVAEGVIPAGFLLMRARWTWRTGTMRPTRRCGDWKARRERMVWKTSSSAE